LSRERISNALAVVYGINLKFSACVEGDIEENKRCYVHIATNAATVTTSIATTQAKGIKM